MSFEITKEKSIIIKGIALILMVFAHVCWTKRPYLISLHIGDFDAAKYLLLLGKTCVHIFAFLSGYILFKILSKNSQVSLKNNYKMMIKKILSFITGYWLILFTIFVPLYIASGSWNTKQFIFSLIGHGEINHFAWYVYFYIIILLSFPIIHFLSEKRRFVCPTIISFFVVLSFLTILLKNNAYLYNAIDAGITTYISALIGYLFSKEKLLTKISLIFKNKRWLVTTTLSIFTIIIFIIYSIWPLRILMPLFTMIFISSLSYIFSYDVPRIITKPLMIIGKYSMYIWLMHGIIFVNYANKVCRFDLFFFYPKEVIGVTVFIIVIFLPIAFIYSKIHSFFTNKLTKLIRF